MEGVWVARPWSEPQKGFGLEGPGTLTWSRAGLTLTGPCRPPTRMALSVVAGFGVGFVGLVLTMFLTQTNPGLWAVLALLGGPAGLGLGRLLIAPRPLTVELSWAEVQGWRLSGDGSERPLAFDLRPPLFSNKPTGAVFFRPREGTSDALLQQLRSHAAR